MGVHGTCLECGKVVKTEHLFIVRNETWALAVPGGWTSGHLHLHCLEVRLQRKVEKDELLVWCIGKKKKWKNGKFETVWVMQMHPDYRGSPEYIRGTKGKRSPV